MNSRFLQSSTLLINLMKIKQIQINYYRTEVYFLRLFKSHRAMHAAIIMCVLKRKREKEKGNTENL